MDRKIELAFRLWKLVKTWQVKDAQFNEYSEKAKIDIEVLIGDIVKEYPELEDLIPNPICRR